MTKHLSPDERSAQILEAALACFVRKGYTSTKMDEIAKEAGLSKGGVYFHFGSKREIFDALVRAEYDHSMGFLESARQDDVLAMFLEVGEHFSARFEGSDSARLMSVMGEMALRDDEIRETLVALQRNYIDKLSEILTQAIEGGALRGDLDVESTALALKALIDGIQMLFTIDYPVDLDRLLAAGMSLVTQGLQPG